MLGKPVTEFATLEETAERASQALQVAIALEPSEERDDIIQRNAKHLQIVIDRLDITSAKRAEYQKLISDNLVE
jgi:precorrin-6B methylase 2